MRFAATIAYDGTAYHGFQRQKNAPTIQLRLEEALSVLTGGPVSVMGAGRTDTGVHATGQVVAFDLDWKHGPSGLRSALNANLPPDIAVREVWVTSDKFHPRFDARSRSYEYRLYVADVRDPFLDRRAWRLASDIDAAAIVEAAGHLLGKQDFIAFGTPPRGENAVRTVSEAVWRDSGDGEYRFYITADAFLYRMVRTITATLVRVGRRQMTADDFRGILAARQRGLAAPPAPACGLTLVAVTYSEQP
jgi:tRNA pseudouridine38-40 synthase